MAPTVHAELTKDGAHFAIAVAGGWLDQQDAWTAISHMTPEFKFPRPNIGTCKTTWPALVQFSSTFNGRDNNGWWMPGPKLRDWAREEYARRTSADGLPPMTWVGTDGRTPREYQLDAAEKIAHLGRYLLCDSPGLGKTTSVILGLDWRAKAGIPVLPIIVITPSWSVCDVWAREIAIWQPAWRTAMWGGTKRQELAGTADVYLTTYATARRDGDDNGPLMKLKAATTVLDESHLIKESTTKTSYAARRLARKSHNAILLTGTPITRSTRDLWAAFEAKDPGAWPAAKKFTDRYCVSRDGEYEVVIQGLDRFTKPEFFAAILGSWRRVAKEDVLDQLPPKVYSTRRVDIPEPWRTAYKTMERDMLAQLPDGEEIPVMHVIEQLTRLVQLSSSAADVEIEMVYDDDLGEEKPKYKVTLKSPSWKADALLEILAERPGQPVVCFAPSRQLIEITGKVAEEAGYRVGYVTGKIPRAKRAAYIDAFQRDELDLMVATTGAGGTGITLTAAGTVVFLQRPWSLAESIQSEDRAHRLGSERHEMVEIIDVVAKGSIDSRIKNVLTGKSGQLADFLGDPRIVHEMFGGGN